MKIIAKNSSLVFKQTVLPENLYKEENVLTGYYTNSNVVGVTINIDNKEGASCYCIDNVRGKTLCLKAKKVTSAPLGNALFGFLTDSNDIVTHGYDTEGFGADFWTTNSVYNDGVYTKTLIIPENSNKLAFTIKYFSLHVLSDIKIYDITDYQ